MLGPINMALNLGASIGPVIGGVVSYISGSCVWVFWALVIVGVVLLCGVGLSLTETARGLVGNGDDPSRYKWWQLSWLSLARQHISRSECERTTNAPTPATEQHK